MPETLTSCPICQSAEIYTRTRNLGATPVSVCKACGQHFVNPRMTDAEVDAYYLGAYWNEHANDTGLSDENLIRHRERARTQVILMRQWLVGLRSCLEIGCSAGYLIDNLHNSFEMECIGVEPDERHHAVFPARYHKIYKSVQDVPTGARFDLLALSHSLEHLNHPLEFMGDLIDQHAYAGTRILIEVPNLPFYPTTLTPVHPFAYDTKTLLQLMARLGYAPLEVTTHGLGGPVKRYLLAMFECTS